MTIIIIASNRTGFYLTEVVAGIVRNLIGSSSEIRTQLAICNVNVGTRFEELSAFEDKIRIIDVNPSLSYDLTSIQSRIRKETDDYWKCLNESLKFQSSYVLLLEDDAVPVDGFFTMMQSLKIQLDQRPYIDYVKLYHPRSLRKIPSLVQVRILLFHN